VEHVEKGSSGISVAGAGRFEARLQDLVIDCTECLFDGAPDRIGCGLNGASSSERFREAATASWAALG
jgi:hypothetical protein